MDTSIIGFDIAKTVFQAWRWVDGKPKTDRLRRDKVLGFFEKLPKSTVAMEACGSAHHWARELGKLGHDVVLIPAAYVKPFLKRNKTDARDAEAIYEAACRPNMRTVPVKTQQQQASKAFHTARDLAVRTATAFGNAIRGTLAEFGVIAAKGEKGMEALIAVVERGHHPDLPPGVFRPLRAQVALWKEARIQADDLEREIKAEASANPQAKLLMTIPGVGPITSHAILLTIGDPNRFRSGRDVAAYFGLTPVVDSSAHRLRLGAISRAGDTNVRRLLTLGASSHLRQAKAKPERQTAWVSGILGRRPIKVATIAQAAKTARIAWAILKSGKPYDGEHAGRFATEKAEQVRRAKETRAVKAAKKVKKNVGKAVLDVAAA